MVPPTEPSPLVAHGATPAELRDRIEAERGGAPFLVFRDGAGAQRLFVLEADRTRVSLGRSPGNDISLVWDTEVSRLHVELERLGDEWTLSDDGLSRNGSFVNGRRIVGRTRLRDGDIVRVGQTSLAFRVPDSPDSRPTQAGAGTAPSDLTAAQRRVLVALCRPYAAGEWATPATNQQIAAELFLSVDAVKAQLRALFQRFALDHLPQNQKRAVLAMRAMQAGLVTARDLEVG
jgi:hypothetical protein